jgi:hypothetical protein
MGDLRLVFAAVRGEYAEAMARRQRAIAEAASGAIGETADRVKREGRAAIGAAGFSRRWQNALRVDIYPRGKPRTASSAIYIFHNIRYAGVFEKGATIRGSPLLWLPLPTAPLQAGGRRVTAGNYRELIGSPLHTIRRPGKAPLLAAYVAGMPRAGRAASVAQLRGGATRARRASANAAFGGSSGRFAVQSLPLFVGVPSVHLRQRFNLAAIFKRAAAGLRSGFRHRLEQLDG